MDELIYVAGREYKTSTQLQRVFAEFVLAVPAGFGAFAGLEVEFVEQVQQRRLFEFQGAVGKAVSIDQQREPDAGVFTEGAGVVASTQANGDQLRAFRPEFPFVVAQLRDVLTAEDSSVVAEKDHDRRTIGPERAQLLRVSIGVGKRDIGKPAAESCVHGRVLSMG